MISEPWTQLLLFLILSAASLVVALYVGIKQYTMQKNSNNLPATWELLAQWQKPELIEAFDFIMNDLGAHDPEEGLAGLPSEGRAKVLNVAYFLQHVAMLIALDIIDERVFTAFLRRSHGCRLGQGRAVYHHGADA